MILPLAKVAVTKIFHLLRSLGCKFNWKPLRMSLACGIPLLECVYAAGCLRWAWKRCIYVGEYDSATWEIATYEEFKPIPHICRTILAVYEEDLSKPLWAPPGGYRLNLEDVLKRVDYDQTEGYAPPYLIYVDHAERDIILAIRGLNLGVNTDYKTLLDNKLGSQLYEGGYVHRGLLKSAAWLLNKEAATLIELIKKYPSYTLTFAGHSLGSGVAAMMTLVVANNREALGSIPREKLRSYGMAPARCMSLNLALQYADIIQSVILQDDFLPRTATPLEDIFGAVLCLPCMLMWRCCIDTCTSEKRKFKDPRRLYAPGRMFHIVERHICQCGRLPPEVRTSVPVEGRFDQVVLSCNATSDHSIVEIEREAEAALRLLLESVTTIPIAQKMERQQSVAEDRKKDHRAALDRARTLKVPFAFTPEEEEVAEESTVSAHFANGQGSHNSGRHEQSQLREETQSPRSSSQNWNVLANQLFSKRDEEEPGRHEQSSLREETPSPRSCSQNWNVLANRLFSKRDEEEPISSKQVDSGKTSPA